MKTKLEELEFLLAEAQAAGAYNTEDNIKEEIRQLKEELDED